MPRTRALSASRQTTSCGDGPSTGRNKLARTFAAQVEALKRYRSGGEQKMTVQHVHVADGGQAIVGNVSTPAQPSPATCCWSSRSTAFPA
jgi:hypothetical protein